MSTIYTDATFTILSAHRVSGFGRVSAVTDWHPDLLSCGVQRSSSWVEIDGAPVRLPSGGIDVYGSHESAAFAARMLLARLEREALPSQGQEPGAVEAAHD